MIAAIRNRLGAGVAMMLIAMSLIGGPSGSVAVVNLIQQADVVVVADIVGGSDSGSQVTMEISVIRVLKGSIEPGKVLVVQWQAPGNRSSAAVALPRRTALFFLRTAGGGLTALPVIAGDVHSSDLYISVPSGNLPFVHAYQVSAALGDKITAELAAAMESPDSAKFAAGIGYLEGLESIKSPTLVSTYQSLAASASTDTAALGIAGMARNGDAAALRRVNAEYDTLAKSPNFQQVVISICEHYRQASAQGVAALTDLASSSSGSLSLRRCSAHALRAIHTKESLPGLAKLLDSSDQNVRYEAVFGLASFANGLPVQVTGNTANLEFLRPSGDSPLANADTRANMPSLPEFRSNEQKYLNFWRQWWIRVQGKL
jgi:hypothetical protein